MKDQEKQDALQTDSYKTDLRSGVWVFFLLAVFTVGEFLAAVIAPTLGWLLIIVALPKAYFVITEYMHIRYLFNPDEESHS